MTTPRVTRPDLAGDVGDNRDRIRILEAIAPPTLTQTAQWIQIGWPPGPVVSGRIGETRRYPGGWRVIAADPWGVGGAQANDIGWAWRQRGHDQQAANYAAAADTLSFTPEDAQLVTTGNTGANYVTGYFVYATFRADPTDATGVGHIVMNNAYNPNGDGDIPTWLYPSARTGLAKFDSTGSDVRYFEAGETITVKAFHTNATARTIYIDQIYFIPSFQIYPLLGTGNTDATDITSAIASFAVTGPTAGVVSDDSFGNNVVYDTQAINHLWDPAMTFSFWSADYGPFWGGTQWDFDMRHMRHNYISARLDATVEGDNTYTTFITQMGNSGQPVSCWIPSTNAGLFYLGPVVGMLTPPQYVLWQANAEGTGNIVPFAWGDETAGVVTDVRVWENYFSSSWLDDEASQVFPPVYP